MKFTHRLQLRLLLLFIIVVLSSIGAPGVAVADRRIAVRYEFAAPEIVTAGDYHSVTIEGLPNLNRVGAPRLPIKAARVLVPFGQRASGITVTCDAPVTLEGSYVVEPGQEPVPLSHEGPVTLTRPSPSIYNASAPFPGVLHSAPATQMRKGYRMLVVTLYPVQYVPQEGTLSYCTNMTVWVDTRPDAAGGHGMLRRQPRQWAADREEIQSTVDNPQVVDDYPSSANVEPFAQHAASPLNPATPCDYVIITNEELMGAPGPNNFQALAAAKGARGIRTVITTTEWISATYSGARPSGGVDLQTKIREFIVDAYQTWGIEYVLLGGDGDGADVGGESGDVIVPHRGFYVAGASHTDYDIPADMYYACLDGTFDHDRDGIYAEPNDGPGGGEVDLYAEVYVGRAAVDSAEELANFVAKTLAYGDEDHAYLHDAWMVGELLWDDPTWGGDYKDEIKEGASTHGHTTVGFEDSAYAPFFDVHTLYDRDTPGHDWPKSAIIDAINSPAHIINHDGHSDVDFMIKMFNFDVDNSLTNDHYFIGYSQGCYDGAFDNRRYNRTYSSSDSIGEHITVGTHGAVAFVGNSRYGWGMPLSTDGASQHFDRQFWDAVLGESIFNIGRANQDSKEDVYGIVGAGGFDWGLRWVYYGLNLFGDPDLVIKTGADLVVYQHHVIDDDDGGGSSGNGNGRVDGGETVEMLVTLRNGGGAEVMDVTAALSTADPCVTLTEGLAGYGGIAAGGVAAGSTPYVFSVDLDCPGDHWITFTLDITGTVGVTGTVETWGDTFYVQVHSEPLIVVTPASFDETLGWGATATRTLTITNDGPAALEFAIGEVGDSSLPLQAGCSETYGSWDGGSWIGSRRDRGNIFRADFSTVLREIRFYLDFPTSTDMYFFVYESDALMGTYTKIHETFIPSTGTGEGWYSSGPVVVLLGAGRYYYVGASWNGSATYGRSTETVPMPADCLGTLETGAPGGLAGYPPVDGFTNSHSGQSPYYMYLEFGGDVAWLSEDPVTGTVPGYDAMPVAVVFDGSQIDEPGNYRADLWVSSNDPYAPVVGVPVTMTVPSTNTAPTLSGLPDLMFDQGTSLPGTIDLWSYASDLETPVGELTYTVEGPPPAGAGVWLEGNRCVHVDPSPNWCGGADVTARVADPEELSNTDTFRVAVSWFCPDPVEMPGAPVLIAPVDGSIAHTVTPVFDWYEVGGAEGYQLQMDNADTGHPADFSSPLLNETLAGTDYTPASELGRGTYTWRVRAMNDSEVGAWSEEWAFIVGAPSLPRFRLYLPAVTKSYAP